MPRFTKATVPVHDPTWAPDEVVQLRPRKRWDITLRAEQAAIPPEVMAQARAMMADGAPTETVNELLSTARSDEASTKALLLGMIVSWTFRYPPTPEQESAGQPGDPVPVTAETVGDFDQEEFAYITAAINALGGGVEVPEPAGNPFPHADESAGAGQSVSGAGDPTSDPGVESGGTGEGDALGLRPDSAPAS